MCVIDQSKSKRKISVKEQGRAVVTGAGIWASHHHLRPSVLNFCCLYLQLVLGIKTLRFREVSVTAAKWGDKGHICAFQVHHYFLLICSTVSYSFKGSGKVLHWLCVSTECSPSCLPLPHPPSIWASFHSWIFSVSPSSANEFHKGDVNIALELFYREILHTE